MDSENLRNRSPDLQRVRGANADHRLHHRSAWSSEDPWTHRGTDLACATPDANRSRSLILRLRRYELSIPRSSLVSRPSRARLLNVERESARSAALFADSQSSQKLCRGLSQRNCTENQTKKPNTVKSNPPSPHQAQMKRRNYFLDRFWFPILPQIWPFWSKFWITLRILLNNIPLYIKILEEKLNRTEFLSWHVFYLTDRYIRTNRVNFVALCDYQRYTLVG